MPKDAVESERKLVTVMTHPAFRSKVRAIADRRNMTMAEALDKYATGIDREYRKVLDEMNREIGGEG